MMTEKAMREAERRFEIDARLMEIMGIVIVEWESDPASVQCFDLNIVREAKSLWEERKTCRLPLER